MDILNSGQSVESVQTYSLKVNLTNILARNSEQQSSIPTIAKCAAMIS